MSELSTDELTIVVVNNLLIQIQTDKFNTRVFSMISYLYFSNNITSYSDLLKSCLQEQLSHDPFSDSFVDTMPVGSELELPIDYLEVVDDLV